MKRKGNSHRSMARSFRRKNGWPTFPEMVRHYQERQAAQAKLEEVKSEDANGNE